MQRADRCDAGVYACVCAAASFKRGEYLSERNNKRERLKEVSEVAKFGRDRKEKDRDNNKIDVVVVTLERILEE